MIRMDNFILNLYNENIISKEQALNHAINPSEISQKLNGPNI